jgi:hypothetical protein
MGVKITCLPERPQLTKDADGWEHYAYAVVLTFQGRTMSSPFKCGSGHARKSRVDYGTTREAMIPVPPSAADVLYSLISDSDACDKAFEEWAGDLGYDTDSRKALATYLECQRLGREVRAFLAGDYDGFETASREH